MAKAITNSTQYLGISAAARYLSCSEQLLRQAVDQGRLPCVRDRNGSRVFHRVDLDRFAIATATTRVKQERRRR